VVYRNTDWLERGRRAQIENVENLKPVLVNVEEVGPSANLAFEKER